MELKPLTVSPELAEAALACPRLARPRALASLVGRGRKLTRGGVLSPAVATRACRELGIATKSATVRSAADVPELMAVWETALVTGLIAITADVAYASRPEGPEESLEAWLALVAAQLGLPDEICPECLTLLYELSVKDGPVRSSDLVARLTTVFHAAESVPFPRSDSSEPHEAPPADDDGIAEHVHAAMSDFNGLGAVKQTPSGWQLTPLGQMLAESIFVGCATPPAADAVTLMATVGAVGPGAALAMAEPWLAVRSPADAVRELLEFAATAKADMRFVTVLFAQRLGPEAAPAWREWAKVPGFGAYARQWLAAQGETVPEMDDAGWLAAEEVSLNLATVPEESRAFMLDVALERMAEGQIASLASTIEGSGHPDAEALIEMIAALVAKQAAKVELKVPKAMQPLAAEIMNYTDQVCAYLLDQEYAELARQAVAKLARKRPSPLTSGRPVTWAAGIVYALGQVNFLFDSTQQVYSTADELSRAFGVAKTTMSNKAKQVRDLLKMSYFAGEFQREDMLAKNPAIWFVQTEDGLILDARQLPVEQQAEAFLAGVIPYIPALGQQGTAEFMASVTQH